MTPLCQTYAPPTPTPLRACVQVRSRCTRFPPESRVAEQVARETAWEQYKRGVLATISTKRWPAEPGGKAAR
jgi:hypothetical protein